MPDIKILTESDLRDLVPLDLSVVDCVEQGFVALAKGGVEMPPILSMAIAESDGEVDVKTAHIAGADSFTIKASPGFTTTPSLGCRRRMASWWCFPQTPASLRRSCWTMAT